MANLREFLLDDRENGDLLFSVGVFSKFSDIGDSCYSEICGGYYEGVHQWFTHNVDSLDECENKKYKGWTITFENGRVGQIYIPNWVLDAKVNDWKHAKNLFCKYLTRKLATA